MPCAALCASSSNKLPVANPLLTGYVALRTPCIGMRTLR